MRLDENDVNGGEHFVGGAVVAAVRFRVRRVTNQYALNRAAINLGVVLVLDQHKRPRPDFTQM